MSAPSGPSEHRSERRRKTYTGTKVRRFAWLPRRVSDGSWIWLKGYYVWTPYTLEPEKGRSGRRWF
jgi:hypothetical protein